MVGSSSKSRARGMGAVLRLLAVGALATLAVAVSVPVGAAGDSDQVTCIPINYTTCVQPVTGGYTVPTLPTYTAPTYTAPTYAAPATATLPANSLVSTYFDPRYCGDGNVSVVTDASGHLINVCTSTGVRIYPVFSDYGQFGGLYGGLYGGAVPYAGYFNGTAYAPAYLNGTYAYAGTPIPMYTGNYVNGYFGAPYYGTSAYQYTDNRFCGDGQVSYTPQGYFCTTSGVPAYRSA
jgi:hypothetical protein